MKNGSSGTSSMGSIRLCMQLCDLSCVQWGEVLCTLYYELYEQCDDMK